MFVYSFLAGVQVNSNTQTFNVTPPSSGCVVQSNIMYTMNANVEFTASGWLWNSATQAYVRTNRPGTLFPIYGQDFAIAQPNPLNSLVSNWQCQINNATAQFNNQAIDDIVHLMTTPSERAWKGVTSRTPMFPSWDLAHGTTTGLGSMADLQGPGDVPPGAYEIQWVLPSGWNNIWGYYLTGPAQYAWRFITSLLPAGTPLGPIGTANSGQDVVSRATLNLQGYGASGPIALLYDINGAGGAPSANAVGISYSVGGGTPPGLPTVPPYFATLPASQVAPHVSNYAFNSLLVDTVQCPPFGWTLESGYMNQGLWGVNNMLITAQLTDPGQARWLQGTKAGGLTSLNYLGWTSLSASLWFTYLSPSTTNVQVLPPRCVMPMMYKQVTTFANEQVVAPGALQVVTVPSYTFSQISDVLMISVRPTYVAGNVKPDGIGDAVSVPFNETSFCATFPNQPFTQMQYANIPGCLSNLAAHQLVAICRKNGATASVAQYGGLTGSGLMMLSGVPTYTGGAPIVLRPGTDFNLPQGITPGSMGNIQLQYTLQFRNQGSRAAQFTVTTTALSTGYFVLDNGAARQVTVGLNANGILKAPLTQDKFVTSSLEGGGFLGTLAAWAGKTLKKKLAHVVQGATSGAARGLFGHGDEDSREHGGATAGAGVGAKRKRGSLFDALSRS